MTTPEPSTARVLTRGLASAWFSAGVSTVCSLWLAPFALSRLDREEYPIFILGNDVLLLLTFLDLGLTGALSARLAPHGSSESTERDRIASTGFAAQSFISALTLVVGLALAWAFPFLFEVPTPHAAEVRWVLAILAVATALTAATKTYNAILIANRRLYLNHLTQTWVVLVRTALVAGGLWLGLGLPALAYGTLAATIFTALQTRFLVHRHLPLVRLSWSLADRETLAAILRLGIWVSLNGMSVIALRTIDRFIVAQSLSLAAVTSYALTGRIYDICQNNLSQITNTAWPLLAELLSKDDKKEARRVWRGTSSLSSAGSVVIGLAVWSGNGAFTRSWVSPLNYGGIWLDGLLMLNMALLVTISSFRSALTGASVVKPQACSRLAEAFVFSLVGLWSAPVLGIAGIAAAKLIATVLGFLWMPARVAYLLAMTSRAVWLHVIGRFVGHTILCLPIALAGRMFADAGDGFLRAGISAAAVGLTSAVCVLHLGLRHEDRRFVSQALERNRLGRMMLKLRIVPRRTELGRITRVTGPQ